MAICRPDQTTRQYFHSLSCSIDHKTQSHADVGSRQRSAPLNNDRIQSARQYIN